MAAKRKKKIDEEQVKEWVDRVVEKIEEMDCGDKKDSSSVSNVSSGWFWFLGAIGSLLYFWQYVDSFSTGVIAIGKAFFWPAFLIYHFFQFLRI